MTEFLHPRVSKPIQGHSAAEALFLESFNSKRMHHAWLITGKHGIGKATFAYRVAKFLLSNPANGAADLDSRTEISAKVMGQSHPDFLVLETGGEDKDGKEVKEIKVEDVRKIAEFLSLTPAESKYRIVLIDSADQMNINAANALLKLLEEPPANAIILLTCHSVGRILPTIRSRCRTLRLQDLAQESFNDALQRLFPDISKPDLDELFMVTEGSVGLACTMHVSDTVGLYKKVEAMFAAKRTQSQILELATMASDEQKWRVISYSLLKVMRDKVIMGAKQDMSDAIESKLDYIEKVEKMIASANRIHLDKVQVITALLG